MFVHYFVHIDQPLEVVEERLLKMFGRFNGWAEAAYRDGEALRQRIGVGVGDGHRLVAKQIRMDVGLPARYEGRTTVIPLRWEATGSPGLFPRMSADLVVTGLGPNLCQLAFQGSYKVPLGSPGRVLDRMLLNKVAEASVKSFVDRIAERIESPGDDAEGG